MSMTQAELAAVTAGQPLVFRDRHQATATGKTSRRGYGHVEIDLGDGKAPFMASIRHLDLRSDPPATGRSMPEIEIDQEMGAPQAFQTVKHARRHDGVRGLTLAVRNQHSTNETFMTYEEAVKLHDALGAALAFLDADGE